MSQIFQKHFSPKSWDLTSYQLINVNFIQFSETLEIGFLKHVSQIYIIKSQRIQLDSLGQLLLWIMNFGARPWIGCYLGTHGPADRMAHYFVWLLTANHRRVLWPDDQWECLIFVELSIYDSSTVNFHVGRELCCLIGWHSKWPSEVATLPFYQWT